MCRVDRDCLATAVCDRGTCIDASRAPDAGTSPLGGENDVCTRNTDCNAPLVCLAGLCSAECIADRDCRDGESCDPITRTCRRSSVDAGPADSGGDAAGDTEGGTDSAPDGGKCFSDDECDDKLFCNGAERCVGGSCAAASEGPCTSHTACVVDACDEAAKKCTTKTTATKDDDGDGHAPTGCGGDDCDDKDKSVHAGATELCDGKDNDCNGKVDDGARTLTGASFGPASTPYGPLQGAAFSRGTDRTWALTWNAGADPIAYRLWLEAFGSDGASIGGAKELRMGTLSETTVPRCYATNGSTAMLFTAAHSARLIERYGTGLVYAGSQEVKGATYDVCGATWTGSHYAVAYPSVAGLHYTFLDASLADTFGHRVLPTVDGKGFGGFGGRVLAAASKAATAFVYNGYLGRAEIALFDPTGAVPIATRRVSPLDGSTTLLDVVATTEGFLVVFRYPTGPVQLVSVSDKAVVSPPQPLTLPTEAPTSLSLVSDGAGLATFGVFGSSASAVFLPLGPTKPGDTVPLTTSAGAEDLAFLAAFPGGKYTALRWDATTRTVVGRRLACP